MMDKETIYRATIQDIVPKISRNHTPYIDLVAKKCDGETLNAYYYFTDKSKCISYYALFDLLNEFDIELDEENFLNCLEQLKGKEVYLTSKQTYSNQYNVSKSCEENTNK